MSPGPSTRNKNKRRIQEDDTEITYGIYLKIYSSGEVSTNDVNQLYMISKPVCQACRQNTRNNPNCFCCLVPPPNGSRKSGLWQKISQILSGLGYDPSKDIRAPHTPTGLKNLGATCYVNSILQCLYMNKSFRDGIFSSEINLLEQYPVLNQLVTLFAQLHSCKMTFVDPAPFIKILELDNGVQQDSHEFLTLLLSLLERCLSHSNVPKVRTVVQDLFRGNVTHVTRCSKCGTESAASSNMEDFYGLELNVKGLKSLDESLDEYLSLEELHGDNQYFCDCCMMRVDATHCVKLHSLPTILNFQLKRCVFIPKTTTKKKITSPFSFPGVLCMEKRMSEPSQLELLYDLSAILIHKGVAVNSGHYVAHIKDDNTGQWWELDDEHVSNLGFHPLGEGSSSVSSLKSVVSESVVPKSSEDDIGKPKMDTYAEEFSSCDAYMLMYCRRQSATTSDDIHPVLPDGPRMNDENLCSLPSHLCEEIRTLNDSYLESCRNYSSKKETELKLVACRREEVRSVLSEAPVSSLEEPYYWISTDWLRQWADEIHVSAVDNTKICCVHGKAPVNNISMMKRLSKKSWISLVTKHGGGPSLSDSDHCTVCLIAEATNLASAAKCKDHVSSMRKLAEEALSRNCMDEKSYYVSKVWLQQWMRKKNVDCLCEADAGPTAAIRCPHGELMPDCGSAGKRLLIPEKLWLFFVKRANELKPDDILGCSAFPSDLEPCAQCYGELVEAACLEDSLRTVKLRQRQIHENLALGKSIPLSLHCRYYLLPSSWLLEWRNYVSASGKNSALFMKPDILNGIINSLKCTKHSLLLERPVDVLCRRGIIIQKPTATDGLTIILENDWKLFCQDWGGTEENCLIADIEASSSTGCSDNLPILVDDIEPHDSCNDQSNFGQFVIRTDPEVCEECIGERESRDLIEKCSYNDEDICVCFVEDKDPPKSILEASQSSDLDRRISKRSKKTTFGKSKNFKVSGSTTVYQLKMMIWESFGIVKEDQVLHKGSIIIEGDTTTLADASIFPGNILWVKDSEIHGYRDIAEELSEDRMVESREPEEGFRGTLLTLNV